MNLLHGKGHLPLKNSLWILGVGVTTMLLGASFLAHAQTARAGNSYLPIPFARSCKVTMAAKPFYYLINCRAYPEGTTVEPFTRAGYDAAATDLAKAGKALTAEPHANQGAIQKAAPLQPGDRLEVTLPAGSNAIRQFTVRLPGAVANPARLRSTALQAEARVIKVLGRKLALGEDGLPARGIASSSLVADPVRKE